MKFEISKEWVIKMANLEEDQASAVSVQLGTAHSLNLKTSTTIPGEIEKHAFGRLISLMRRESNMTLEALSDSAAIELDELLEIEADPGFRPEPRTVYQLANTFNLSVKSLLQVAGLALPQNDAFFKQTVRFAARSDPLVQLTHDEKEALHEYIDFLNMQK